MGRILEKLKRSSISFRKSFSTLTPEQAEHVTQELKSSFGITEKPKCPYCQSIKIKNTFGEKSQPKSLWACKKCGRTFYKHQLGV